MGRVTTLNIAHTLHNWKVSSNFQQIFIIVPMSGPGGRVAGVYEEEEETWEGALCLGLAHWLCGRRSLSTGDASSEETTTPT